MHVKQTQPTILELLGYDKQACILKLYSTPFKQKEKRREDGESEGGLGNAYTPLEIK